MGTHNNRSKWAAQFKWPFNCPLLCPCRFDTVELAWGRRSCNESARPQNCLNLNPVHPDRDNSWPCSILKIMLYDCGWMENIVTGGGTWTTKTKKHTTNTFCKTRCCGSGFLQVIRALLLYSFLACSISIGIILWRIYYYFQSTIYESLLISALFGDTAWPV